jgi:hypothetical protein
MADSLAAAVTPNTHLGVGFTALPTNAQALIPSGDYSAADPTAVKIPTLNAVGLMIFVHMTVASGAGNTVTVNIDAFDPVSGGFITIGTAALTSAVADFIVVVDPRIAADPATPSGSKHVQVPLPDQLRIRPVKSGTTTTLTYSVGAALCL